MRRRALVLAAALALSPGCGSLLETLPADATDAGLSCTAADPCTQCTPCTDVAQCAPTLGCTTVSSCGGKKVCRPAGG